MIMDKLKNKQDKEMNILSTQFVQAYSKTQRKQLIKTLSIVAITGLLPLSIHAEPAQKLNLTLSEHSKAKIRTLMNDPKVWQQIPKELTLCVFSPDGANGEAYEQATTYISELPRISQVAKEFGVDMKITRPSKLSMKIDLNYPKLKKSATTDINIRVYTDERVLTEDFRSKKCDGAGISNLRARQFNPFVGSIDALGAVQSYKQLSTVIQLLARPEYDAKMVNKDYEIVGVVPLGAAYIMVNDRRIDTISKAAGKKVAVMNFDGTQRKLVQNVGAQPVSVDLLSVGGKFNNKEVDIMAGPALLFKPLELQKGMTDKSGKVTGGIIKFPLIQVTGTLIMHRNKFPVGMGPIAREMISKQLAPAFTFVDKIEKEIPDKYWMDIREADKPGYVKIMREARIQMTKEGYYDPAMMKILKKIRCNQNPTNAECSLSDE